MRDNTASTHWTQYFVYRSDHLRTTWKLRIGFLVLVIVVVWLSRGWWTVAIARSLVCEETLAPSDAILIENFDPDYQVFELARDLRRAGLSARVLVPVPVEPGTMSPDLVSLGIVEVMSRISQIGDIEIIPFRDTEPITLNALRDVHTFLEREHIRSVIAVTPLFRSRRSQLIYSATLGRAGIAVYYQHVHGSTILNTWTRRWHGVEDVMEQWLKLQYYRFYVIPFT